MTALVSPWGPELEWPPELSCIGEVVQALMHLHEWSSWGGGI